MAVREFTAGSRPQTEWGWLVILDFFVGGAGAGLFMISVALGSPFGLAASIVLVLIGGGLLLGDLSRPIGAWRVIARPKSSWLSRGTIGILVLTVTGIVHLGNLLSLPGSTMASSIAWANVAPWEKPMAVIASLAALFVALYPGFLLGAMRSVPLWNNVLSPILFLCSSLLSGLGLAFMLPVGVAKPGALSILTGLGIGLVVLQIVIVLSVLLTSQSEVTKVSVHRLTRGSLSLPFYAGLVVIGLALPLALLAVSLLSPAPGTAIVATSGVLLLAGQFFLRMALVKAGVYTSTV